MIMPQWLQVYGDINYRGPCPMESAEQGTFFNQLRTQYPSSWGLIATHVKNEGKRTQAQIMKDKSQGLTKGAPDIMIPARITFICELKRRDHMQSRWQPAQLDYMKVCHDSGAFVCLALGYDAAWQAFNDWLELI